MTDAWDSPPEDLRAFIAAEKACPSPALDVQTRVRARVAGTLGLLTGPLQSPPAEAPGPQVATGSDAPARLARAISRRGLATFLVGAAVGATTMGTVDRMRSERMRSKPTPVPFAMTSASPGLPVLPPVIPPAPVPVPQGQLAAAAPSTLARPVPRTTVVEPKDKRLEAERKLVEMARTALARGQSDGALPALRRHLRLFPRGELAEERDSLWVSALVARGEPAQAREHAARFHRQYPHSLFATMVDQAIQSIP
jgi:hypothetical protein